MTGRDYVSGVIFLVLGAALLGASLGLLGVLIAWAVVVTLAILERRL